MSNLLRWGILATGKIAHTFARGLRHSKAGRLVAVGSRAAEPAAQFGAKYRLLPDHCHGSYEALLADPDVDAVYLSNPHPGHAEWAIKAAAAGKHILCEKPLAMNADDARAIVEAAQRHGVFLMEAFMYRCHPQTQRLAELIRDGAIGPVQGIQATFSYRTEFDPASRLFDPALGGGGILDVGCYPVSMSRLIAGAATGQAFANPVDLCAAAVRAPNGVDAYAAAVATFPSGIIAQWSCGLRAAQECTVRVYGENGWIHVAEPWKPGVDGTSRLFLHKPGAAPPEEIVISTPAKPDYLYTLEADHVAAHLDAREAPAMSWADSLGNMETLDRWRAAIGLTYPPAAGR